MIERKLAMYPERPSEMAESYVKAIEIFHNPPEFVLSEEEKAEVKDFESALCNGEFPPGLEFLANSVEKPQKSITEITTNNDLKTFCVDWFATPQGIVCLQKLGYSGNLTNNNEIKSFLAHAVVRAKSETMEDGYEESRLWGRSQLQLKIQEEIEKGSSAISDPEYISLLRSPQKLVAKIEDARNIKKYYKVIDAYLISQEFTNVVDAKLVMLTMHRERINTLIASSYRDALVLLQQYQLSPDVLTSEGVGRISDAFEVLKYADTTDVDKMARIYSMIDKFITGIDIENGFGQISSEIQRLEMALQKQPEQPEKLTHNKTAEKLTDLKIDATELKKLFELALTNYGLLSAESDFSKFRDVRAGDKLWQVVISKNYTSLDVDSDRGVIWVPETFSRRVNQLKPTGVLPLIDHEMTHVFQHENAEKLNIELLVQNRAARGNLWFETGATEQEYTAFETYFGINRGTNFHYLRAMQKQLDGGTISECAKVFYDSLVSSGDTLDQKTALETAIDRTMRLFRNGTQWSPGSGYLTNTQPLQYAEQQILRRNLPKDLEWLYFVGRANFQTLAQLHRIGWLKKEDVFIPSKMPSEIVLEELVAQQYSA